MADILGYVCSEEKEHKLVNTLDGNLELKVTADRAVGTTRIFLNGSAVCETDAGDGASPWYCGTISLPRGEFLLRAESGCPVGKLLLTVDAVPGTPEEFELLFMNRRIGDLFFKDRVEYTPEMLSLLERHGFFLEDAWDTANGREPSGVPLGGMGCGKLEIAEDGLMTAFTGNNNQDCPIYRMPGSFFALRCGGETRILRGNALGLPYQPCAAAEAELEFPFARLRFADPVLPVTAEIEAFSAHVPGNAADSALPCVFFEVTLKNGGTDAADTAFLFSWENLINVGGSMMVHNGGERQFPLCYHTWNSAFPWSDRRGNRCVQKGRSLVFSAADDRGNPSSFGEHLLWCSEEDAEAVPDRSILPEDEAAFAERFAAGDAGSESEFRAGAWIVRRRLAPGAQARIRFVLAWYMPMLIGTDGKDYGVEYANR
ncbi:MAG: hypothetical protein K6A33_11330, partial [Clostridiales bacterium]|nr:hypothetical protein [Clostridiales bacterium]